MKTAISCLTCDKPELAAQSLPPLLAGAVANHYHLFVVDGSKDAKNEEAIWKMAYPAGHMHANIKGGAGAAIVYALTMMLKHEENYDVVGLAESDVLLRDNWLDCLDLFGRGEADGLSVGAVSARTFEDRVLFQRDGYAVLHNSGAGMVLFTRLAAQLILDNFRTMWTTDNRRIFAQLCGIDIGTFWAFRFNEHFTTADWGWDATLAAHGLASLGLTPSPVEMIGQNPPLAEQGLKIATGREKTRDDQIAYETFWSRTARVREGALLTGVDIRFHYDVPNATWTYFPHQMAMLGGEYSGDWRFEECRGWGTFKWVAGPQEQVRVEDEIFTPTPAYLIVPVFGSCSILVSGGKTGGKVEVVDEQSGFRAAPDLPPEGEQGQVLQMMIPGGLVYRNIRITMLTSGTVFYGIQSREKQPFLPDVGFDHSVLPSP